MKVKDNNRAITKRDLLTKLAKVERALGAQAHRADMAEKECDRLLGEVIRLKLIEEKEGPSSVLIPLP